MGTNYYLVPPASEEAPAIAKWSRGASVHVGKSSAGWRFLFRSYGRWDGGGVFLATTGEWREAIADAITHGWSLEDEYGDSVDPGDFWDFVTGKSELSSHIELLTSFDETADFYWDEFS